MFKLKSKTCCTCDEVFFRPTITNLYEEIVFETFNHNSRTYTLCHVGICVNCPTPTLTSDVIIGLAEIGYMADDTTTIKRIHSRQIMHRQQDGLCAKCKQSIDLEGDELVTSNNKLQHRRCKNV